MKGFKDFIMRGNLVELAVAFIIGASFATVVKTFTDLLMSVISKIVGGQPDFNDYRPGGVPVGAFLTALISFVILAAVVYFFVVLPYNTARERLAPKPDDEPEVDVEVELLKEIRDAIKSQS